MISITTADSLIEKSIEVNLIPGATYSYYSDSISTNNSFGFSSVESEIKFTDSTLVQAGSIGKLFTAIAVLMEVEKGSLDLNEDILKYLPDFEIRNIDYSKITLHHLLTHSSGIDDRNIGILAKSTENKIPLKEHLKSRMPRAFQDAGYSINYSNYGYALAGLIVEKVSGETFENYVQENILRPLKMDHTSYRLPDNYEENNSFAKGYQTKKSGFNFIKLFPRNIVPAGSLITNSIDMEKFIQELVENNKLISAKSYDLFFSQQFSNHPSQTGYTYGFEKPNWTDDLLIKGGKVPGFLSTIIIDPVNKTGLFLSVNTETDNFNRKFLNLIKKNYLSREEKIYNETLENNINHSKFTGSFLNDKINHHTIELFFSTFTNSVEINSHGNSLVLENEKRKYFKPFSDSVFVNENDYLDYLVFTDLRNGKYRNFFYSNDVGGISVPSSFSRIPYVFSKDFLNNYFPFIVLIIFLLIPALLLRAAIWFLQKKGKLLKIRLFPFKLLIIPILFLMLLVLDVVFFWIPLTNNFDELLFGFPNEYLIFKYVHFGMVILAIAMIPLIYHIWKKSISHFPGKLFLTIFSINSLILVYYYYHFSFINMNY